MKIFTVILSFVHASIMENNTRSSSLISIFDSAACAVIRACRAARIFS